MPKISFEPTLLDRLAIPPEGQIDYWDDAVPGFGLRVSQGGGKSWVAMIREAGRKRRITFGSYPELSLDAARNRLDEVLRGTASPALPGATIFPLVRRRGRPRRSPATPVTPSPSIPSAPSYPVFLECSPYPALILADQRVHHINTAAISLFSAHGPEPFIGLPAHSLVHPADQARFVTQFLSKDLVQRQKPRAARMRFMRLDGSSFPAEVRGSTSPGTDDGALCQLAILDLTEQDRTLDTLRRTVEELGAASQAKTEFLATLSHELRIPLEAMLETLHLLCDSRLDTDQQPNAKTVLQSTDALLRLLNDTLDLSKIEAGKLELTKTSFELRSQLEGIVTLFAASARKKGMNLELHVAPDVPRAVEGHGERLRQVLLNLVSNAVKFTETGRVELIVSSLGRRNGHVLLRFEVRDTGIGIPGNLRGRLFQPYSRFEQPSTKYRPGTGLGLVISQRLVRLMGSEIVLESEFGHGSRFHFTLPLLPIELSEISTPTPTTGLTLADAVATKSAPTPAELTEIKPAEAPDVAALPSRAVRLLLCEDDKMARHLILAMLRDMPFEIETVTNGLNAVQRAREGDLDLVLMDVTMPGMNGLDATREIRKLPGKAGLVPIVALTAHAFEEDYRRCLEAGMNAYLVKPISRLTLKEVIARLLPPKEDSTPEQGANAEPFVQLDRAILDRLAIDVGADTVAPLMRGFIEETTTRIQRMIAAHETNRLTELARDAHSLKSSAETFGAVALGVLAGEIEKAAAEGHTAELAVPMQRLPAFAHATLEAFRRYLAS